MERTQSYIGMPNGVVICIDERFSGEFYHKFSRKCVHFHNSEEMVFKLEQFFDSINFPHATTVSRTFGESKRQKHEERNLVKEMSDQELLSRHGDLGSFIVRVQHRQNSSWQGRITWVEENKTVYFRSIWELVKLINSAVDQVAGTEELEEEVTWNDPV